MTGISGPIPKRDAERRRRNDPANGAADFFDIDEVAKDAEPDSLPWKIAQPVVVPTFDGVWTDADGREVDGDHVGTGWHPLAQQWFDSLSYSGQAIFYEPSDWMLAAVIAETLSRELKPQIAATIPATEFSESQVIRECVPIKGASLSAILKAMSTLMVSEGDRRRLRLELQRRAHEAGEGEGGEVVSMEARRRELLG